jgi:hypothetical protein
MSIEMIRLPDFIGVFFYTKYSKSSPLNVRELFQYPEQDFFPEPFLRDLELILRADDGIS